MSKKIKNSYLPNLTFQKLLEAHFRGKKGKCYKPNIIQFELNLEHNLINIKKSLENHTYSLGNYFSFKVYEPKERIIMALPYKDRIVQQWYIEEFIKPYILPRLISTTFACIDDKGTHKAVENVQKQMRIFKRNYGDFWILKCDIKKFFYSINLDILYNIMEKYIEDKDLLLLTKKFIFNENNITSKLGIPIGNYTSQFYANIYLNELDQYLKRVLKIKYYTRYMDDFIILLKTKNECIELKKQIELFLDNNLKLELNAKSRYYPYKMGVNFCGYRIFTTHRLLRTSSKKKIKANVRKWNHQYHHNSLNSKQTFQSLNSWFGHASHSNSYKLKQKIINKCEFLITNNTYNEIESNLIKDIQNNKESNKKVKKEKEKANNK